MAKKFFVIVFLLFLSTSGALATDNNLLHNQALILEEDDSQSLVLLMSSLHKTEVGYAYEQNTYMIGDLITELFCLSDNTILHLDSDYAILEAQKRLFIDDYETRLNFRIDYSTEAPSMAIETYYVFGHKSTAPLYEQVEIDIKGKRLYSTDTAIYKILQEGRVYPGLEYEFQFLDLSNLVVYEDKISIGKSEVYQEAGRIIPLHQIIYDGATHLIDETGTIYQIIPNEPEEKNMIRQTGPEDQALINDILLSVYKAIPNLDLAHPQRSINSLIEISGDDLSKYDFNDNRQRVIKYYCADDSERILLETTKDKTNYFGKAQLPMITEELNAYLQPGSLVDPTLPQIQMLAKNIIGEETDVWKASIKLMNWVWEYINPDLQVKPLRTGEILEHKYGGVSEHVTLFSALARGIGIPTRVAAGLRYTEGYWKSWVWNEVWLGEWIALDASHLQAQPDALLIKLFSGANIEELNTKAIGQLQSINPYIRSVDFIPGPFGPNLDLVTNISGQTYVNADYNCSISLGQNWYFQEATSAHFIASDYSNLATVEFRLHNLHSPINLDHIIDSTIYQTSKIPGIHLYPPEGYEVGLLSGYEAGIVKWGFEYDGDLFYQEQWILLIDDQCYIVSFLLPAIYHNIFAQEFAEFLDSFIIYD